MLNVKKILTKILNTDLVIAQGTSGGWTYRKWSGGSYECWRHNWGTASISFTQWQSLFYADADGPTFPITFTEQPIVLVTPVDSQAYILGCYSITTSKIGKIRFGHNMANSSRAWASIYVKGKWK